MAVESVLSATPVASELVALVERLRRSTVQVRGSRAGAGSGVIWDAEGLIVTNAHVATGRRAVVELWDGRVVEAEVQQRDPQRDLAALQVGIANLPAVSVADSDAVRVGQLAFALGNPLGLVGALTLGIIHAVPREGHRLIEADIRLAPGNSGGPLVDARGHVVGINSMIAGGLGLAVPSNVVQRFLHGAERRPRLGVRLQPVWVPQPPRRPLPGWLVVEVQADSPAEAGGLTVGDVIIGVDGRRLGDPRDLVSWLEGTVGGVIRLDLWRAGHYLTLVLDLSPGGPAQRGEAA